MKSTQKIFQRSGRFLILGMTAMLMFAAVTDAAMQQFKYMSTGTGISSRTSQPEFSLLLKFSEKSQGSLLANIKVVIFRDKEKVFESLSPGPWFFIDLPADSYSVKGTNTKGVTQSAKFKINGKKQQVVILSWDAKNVRL